MANGCDESCGTHVRMASAAGCVYHVMQQLTMGRELKILQLHWLHFNICELPDALAARIATKRHSRTNQATIRHRYATLCRLVRSDTKRDTKRDSHEETAHQATRPLRLSMFFFFTKCSILLSLPSVHN